MITLRNISRWTGAIVFCLFLASCDPQKVYESNKEWDSHTWALDSLATFTFKIQDVDSPYDLSLNIRNSLDYPYYNLFLKYYLLDETSKELAARQVEILLMDSKTGRPLGKGVGDLRDSQVLFLGKYKFSTSGTYTVRLKHYMRQSELPGLYAVGLTVRKSN